MLYFIRAQNCQRGVFSTPPLKNHPAFSQLTGQSDHVGAGTLPATLTQKEPRFISPQEDSKRRKPQARAAVLWFEVMMHSQSDAAFVFKQSYLCQTSPTQATEDEDKRLTHFLSPVPVAVTQGGESCPGCHILAGDPRCTPWGVGASPHGTPSLRVSWTWGRHGFAGKGAEVCSPRSAVANTPGRKLERVTVLLSFCHM